MTMALPDDFQASVFAACANPLPENIVSQYGKRVIRISERQVVKWGLEVTKEEAENQRLAHELVDSRIVRIPRVYDFFSDKDGSGYIVMEFLEGKVIDPLEDISAIERVARVLEYFATLRHNIPGPLSRGFCRGLLFPDTEDLIFDSLEEMETWFNSRLFAHNPKLTLQGCELVLCHLDIAPRNILWQEDGTLCLLDWASAGFYPRLFEFGMQWIMEGKERTFNSALLRLMAPLPDHELAQKEALMWAWRNIQKYSFRSKKLKTDEQLPRDSASFTPVPAPPMPPYPADWIERYERTQRECSAPTKPSPVASLVGSPPSLLRQETLYP